MWDQRPGRVEKDQGLVRYDLGEMVDPNYIAWYVWRGRLVGFRHPQTGYVLRDNVWGAEGEPILRQIAGIHARVCYAEFRQRYRGAFGAWPDLHHWLRGEFVTPRPLPAPEVLDVADCWL